MLSTGIKKIKDILRKAFHVGHTPEKLALSCAIGIFIAFTPFPGVHTIVMFAINWLFRLNFPLLFLTTSINNPWTMIPFYTLDYFFGYWLVHSLMGWSPCWSISLTKIFGSGHICVWSFFVGGMALAVISGLLTYPIMLCIFRRYRSASAQPLCIKDCL